MDHKEKNNHSDKSAGSSNTKKNEGQNTKKKNSDFGAKNVDAQESGGGYDHPPKGASGYKEKNEEEE